MTFAVFVMTLAMQTPHPPFRSQPPIGWGGSYEEYWPPSRTAYAVPLSYLRAPHGSSYWHPHRYPAYFPDAAAHRAPHRHRYPRYSAGDAAHGATHNKPPSSGRATFAQKVDRVCHELSISSTDLSLAKAISQANTVLDLEGNGTLACQLERLLAELASPRP